MRVVILADDFSGAAELAGIAASRGLKSEVQTRFDPGSDAEVIAVDTDTRLRSESEAVRVVGELARAVAASKPDWIYKKTDSVLRGHVRAEVEEILRATGQESCLFVPANPSKGRIIAGGRYIIEGLPLDQTLFARDPDFPARSSMVSELLGTSEQICVPDIGSIADLPTDCSDHVLPAGAADFFTSLLGERETVTRSETVFRILLICGSLAAWDSGRAEEMAQRGFLVRTIDQPPVQEIWEQTDRLCLAIGRPAGTPDSASLTEALVDQAVALAGDSRDLRIALEGGATAIAFLRRMGWERFAAIPENHVGVGTLRPLGGPLLSVKPGSYPWPETLF